MWVVPPFQIHDVALTFVWSCCTRSGCCPTDWPWLVGKRFLRPPVEMFRCRTNQHYNSVTSDCRSNNSKFCLIFASSFSAPPPPSPPCPRPQVTCPRRYRRPCRARPQRGPPAYPNPRRVSSPLCPGATPAAGTAAPRVVTTTGSSSSPGAPLRCLRFRDSLPSLRYVDTKRLPRDRHDGVVFSFFLFDPQMEYVGSELFWVSLAFLRQVL